MANDAATNNPFWLAAKTMWERNPASRIVAWDELTDAGRALLIKDVQAIIAVYERAQPRSPHLTVTPVYVDRKTGKVTIPGVGKEGT